LETEAVSAIEVDGANRKWIGTQTGGVFLVSPDGRTQLRHFTAENSPLPSNTIYAITIDAISGEVFVATDRGIMSFRSDATEGGDTNECATVFPNPVQPGYSGPVAISGLMRDSEVKVADIAGNLVYRTTSLGGQALWPGTDMEGNKVSTGVYMVFVADRSGTSKCRTRVLVVR
jgi:ligand-binding sensor domain-containing protein